MKLLIVDDEFQIRTGLQQSVDWKKAGVTEVLTAKNGIEALQLFNQNDPKIIITDIRMPKIDGLAFIQSIRKLSSDCKIIILSGYSEFDYAKKAIQYDVVDYLLKPINIEKLIKLVTKTVEQVKNENIQSSLFYDYRSERLIQNMINDQNVDNHNIRELFSQKLNWKPGVLLRVCYLQIDKYNEHEESVSKKIDCISEMFKAEAQKIPGIIHRLTQKDYILIMNSENRIFELKKWWQLLNDNFTRSFHTSLSIGVSNEDELKNLPKLYRQANDAIQMKTYHGPSQIHFYYELTASETLATQYTLPADELLNGLQNASFEALKSCIYREFDELFRIKNNTLEEIQNISKQFLHYIYEINSSWNDDANFESLEYLEEFRDRIIQAYEKACTQMKYSNAASNSKSVNAAINYIQKHFNQDISVKDVAEHVQQSPNYFSHKFKQEMGVSFTEFLNRHRIESAVNLLQSKSVFSLNEISRKVGFQNYKYFTQIFKKMKGVSPSKFQKNQ